jgi:hypothetical protein
MRNIRLGAVGLALGASLVIALLSQSGAAGASAGTISIDVAGMVYWADATQGGGPTNGKPPCDNEILVPDQGSEHNGTANGDGSYISNIQLPEGATIRSFKVVARDSDGDINVHAFLLRKRMAPHPGVDGFGGYRVLATVSTSGASMEITRRSTSTIDAPLVQNATFAYFAELVNCADTTDPIGVQVSWTKP